MDRLAELPLLVQRYLGDFVRRWRRLVVLRAAGWALAVLMLWILAACLADRVLQLPALVRLALLPLGSTAAIYTGVRRIRTLRGPIDWVAMAGVIEAHDPSFEQSLITVTSRVLGSPEYRGSDEILSHLQRDVELRVARAANNNALRLSSIARPWLITILAALAIVTLLRTPAMGSPRLLARLIAPLADIAPVTTTELTVTPANAEVFESQPLRIDVEAQRLGSSPVWIYRNDDGQNWSRYTMDDAGEGHYTYTFDSVSRDLVYYVSGGDATSPTCSIRIKRPPTIGEFRVRYAYPAYIGKSPFTISNADGLIEAPIDSDVTLTIVPTEPLQSAMMTVGDQKLLMEPDSNRNTWQAAVHVRRSLDYDLDLISTRNVHGGGPGKMSIRALTDHPPLVRLLQGGQTLRLNRLDGVWLSYQALDDYGIAAMRIEAAINGSSPTLSPLHLSNDRRRQEDTAFFDLGQLPLNVGDVLSLTIVARDTKGQETSSEELRVLVAPHSIDLDARQRIDELNGAVKFAATLSDELGGAAKAMAQMDAGKDRKSAGFVSTSAMASRHLAEASESATLLRQALLRAMTHVDDAALATAVMRWIDAAQQLAHECDELFLRVGGVQGTSDDTRRSGAQALDDARGLLAQLHIAAQGERASAVLADQEDLAVCNARSTQSDPGELDLLSQTLQRAAAEISAGAIEAGVASTGPDVQQQLQARAQAERGLIQSMEPVNFVAAQVQWASELRSPARTDTGLAARLTAAAQARALGRQADPVAAHDLDLLGRAAGMIVANADRSAATRPMSAAQLEAFDRAMVVLDREWQWKRQPRDAHGVDEWRNLRGATSRAREELARLAAQPRHGDDPAPRPAEIESLALHAGAQAERHDYKAVAEIDHQIKEQLTASEKMPGGHPLDDSSPAATQRVEEQVGRIDIMSEALAHQMSDVEAVDKLGETQQKLALETRAAKSASREMAGRQRTVAEEIAAVQARDASARDTPRAAPDGNFRGQATTALLAAQEELAGLPQALSAAQEASAARRAAFERAQAAQQESDAAARSVEQRVERQTRAAEQLRIAQADVKSALAAERGTGASTRSSAKEADEDFERPAEEDPVLVDGGANLPAARDTKKSDLPSAAHREADAAASERAAMLDRAAQQAQRDARDAQERLDAALRAVSPAAAVKLAEKLAPFLPEAQAAHDLLNGALAQSLADYQRACQKGDGGAIASAGADSRNVIDQAQKELIRAQDTFSQRDPLLAARLFARAAADSLSTHPGDMRLAVARQASASLALSRAWDTSVHRASQMRLAMLPSLAPIYAPSPVASSDLPTAAMTPSLGSQWADLHPHEGDDLGATIGDPQPPGYEEPLRLYFEAMGKSQEKPK